MAQLPTTMAHGGGSYDEDCKQDAFQTFLAQQPTPILLAASGAISADIPGVYMITKAGVAAMTLAAPTAGTEALGGEDGMLITISSNTAFAHTITATGLLQTGTASVNAIAFPNVAGATVTLMAYGGKWNVISTGLGTYSLS